MSIGQTGKRAQKLGQTKRERHRLQTGTGDTSALRPNTPLPKPTVARQPDPDSPVQREDEAPTATNTSAAQPSNEPTQSGGGQPSAEELAEKVYALMKKDLHIQRERYGKTRRKI